MIGERRFGVAGLIVLPLLLALLLALLPALGGCRFRAPENEGSVAAPIRLTVGYVHFGEVGASGTSYYRFAAAGNITHTVALTATESDLKWTLYSSADFSSLLVRDCDFTSAGDEICTTSSPLTKDLTYYLKVRELDGVAGTFDLLVSIP